MKRQMVTGLEILITLVAVILTGCVEKNVDYSIDGIREKRQAERNGGKSGLEQFSGFSEWNDEWIANTGALIKVKADILLPETDQMSVVEVEAPEFNAEYKEQIVKRLFGNETVYYYDLEHLPKKDLKERYDTDKELYGTAPDYEHLKKDMELCEAAMENAKDDYMPADEYEMNEYIGKYEGTEYELCFNEMMVGCDRKWIDFRVKDNSAVCPKEYEGYTHYMEHPYADTAENECRIPEEELEKQAVKFVEKLGLEYPVLSYTKPLLWGDNSMSCENSWDWPANGYAFHFEYGMDGVSISGYGRDEEYDNMYGWPDANTEIPYCTGAELTVYVTEQGVIAMTAENPVVTAGITESVELLPLDTIMQIMKEQVTEGYEDFRFRNSVYIGEEDLVFTHMEMIYFRFSDSVNSEYYSYVPAWRLSEQTGKKEIRNCAKINLQY